MVIVLNSTDMEHFHPCRKFYWSELIWIMKLTTAFLFLLRKGQTQVEIIHIAQVLKHVLALGVAGA